MSTYQEKLTHPKWQRRRLEIMQRAEFKCEVCKADDTQLEIHHIEYKNGKQPWEYDDSELRCLCCNCHEAYHWPLNTLWAVLKAREPHAFIKRCDRRRVLTFGASLLRTVELCLANSKLPFGAAVELLKIRREIQKQEELNKTTLQPFERALCGLVDRFGPDVLP